jgi:hypothetical protein
MALASNVYGKGCQLFARMSVNYGIWYGVRNNKQVHQCDSAACKMLLIDKASTAEKQLQGGIMAGHVSCSAKHQCHLQWPRC